MNKERFIQQSETVPIVVYGIMRGGNYLSSLNYMTLEEAEEGRMSDGDTIITFVEKLDD